MPDVRQYEQKAKLQAAVKKAETNLLIITSLIAIDKKERYIPPPRSDSVTVFYCRQACFAGPEPYCKNGDGNNRGSCHQETDKRRNNITDTKHQQNNKTETKGGVNHILSGCQFVTCNFSLMRVWPADSPLHSIMARSEGHRICIITTVVNASFSLSCLAKRRGDVRLRRNFFARGCYEPELCVYIGVCVRGASRQGCRPYF